MRSAIATRWCESTLPASDASAPFGIRIATGGMCSNESGIDSSSTFMASPSDGHAGRAACRECYSTPMTIQKSDDEWRKTLTPEQFSVLREHGTEPRGSSPLNKEKRQGVFRCAGCGKPLFASDSKFESGTGWPSFTQPVDEKAVATTVDRSYGMTRTEVNCAECGGHLGHVFPDGPRPTGLRYCMNGAAMSFDPKDEKP